MILKNKYQAVLLTLFLALAFESGYACSRYNAVNNKVVLGLKIDTTLVEYDNSFFYYITAEQNKKLLIYLHGGVSDPYFASKNKNAELGYMLENNNAFIPETVQHNYDLLIPITNDSLNWLANPEYCFRAIKEYIESTNKNYTKTFISGFSDGGTGSYKMFYLNPNYFAGLIVYNGYPLHHNFYLNVDYSTVTDKKVLFLGTKNDKRIPYEFMLTEYCKQKRENANTYLYVTEGKHDFNSYQEKEFSIVYDILDTDIDNEKKEPFHAFIRKDSVISFYEYRKAIIKRYNYGREYYEENKRQQKLFINK